MLFEIAQVLVISDYSYRVFHSGEVILSFLKCLDNCKKFFIIDVVISFCRGEHGRIVCAGMEFSIDIFLHEYTPSGS